jgi:hypothetical protein
MSSICPGNGECLTQTTGENTYGKSPGYTCEHDCRPILCCNEIVCGSHLPPWFHGLKKAGICICIGCDSTFGKKLDIVENADCPVCLETKIGVTMPNCPHTVCVDCFKRCQYGEDVPQPSFPYPDEIEIEWEDGGRDNPEWCARYPLAKKWEKAIGKWETTRDTKYTKEASLRLCPYCRR